MNKNYFALTTLLILCLMTNAYSADRQAGKEKSVICAGCHGSNGISVSSEYPNLAGQKEQYLKKQLNDFKKGERNNPTMKLMAGSLSQNDIDDLSAYFSSLKLNE